MWERTCNYILNSKKESKTMEFYDASKNLILWAEHIGLVLTGFIGGAMAFYFRSNYYKKINNLRLFTKDEVKEVVNIALKEHGVK